MADASDRLFTPRFFLMCGFSFTVYLSVFQLLPTAPFRIRDMGGSTTAAGLFLGALAFASALSAPLTGAFGDQLGLRRMLIVSSLAIAGFSAGFALSPSYRVIILLALAMGVFWSGLLSASAAYMTSLLPARRRAEGIGYWGLASVAAIAVAPPLGFWVYERGWTTLCTVTGGLNLLMAAIAWRLEEPARASAPRSSLTFSLRLLEWRVLAVSSCLFLYSFGYGGITSFVSMYAEANGVSPKSLFLTTLAVVMLVVRPVAAPLADRIGYKRVFVPSLWLITAGLVLLAVSGSKTFLVLAAVIFGSGFGTAYPAYAAYVMQWVTAERRGAAFGAILAAFDTGIGVGSTGMGWMIERLGYRAAFGAAALLAALAVPVFTMADRRLFGTGTPPVE